MYIFPTGGHGWGLRSDFEYYPAWTSLLKKWLEDTENKFPEKFFTIRKQAVSLPKTACFNYFSKTGFYNFFSPFNSCGSVTSIILMAYPPPGAAFKVSFDLFVTTPFRVV